MSKKHAAGFSSNYANGGRQQSLAEKHGLASKKQERKVITLESRQKDARGRGRQREEITISIYRIDMSLRETMSHEAFYEEVYKTLHADKADVIRARTGEGKTTYYPLGWVEAMYKKYVLGEGYEASPEVEALVGETSEAEA